MTDKRQVVLRALRGIRPLASEDRERIANLGLPAAESVVVGWWRSAVYLLHRDDLFNALLRNQAWERWEHEAGNALEEALRYRENDWLVVGLVVCNILIPSVSEKAGLRGFKAMADVLVTAQRRGASIKRERQRAVRRFEHSAERVVVWLGDDGVIFQEDGPKRQEMWGAAFEHTNQDRVLVVVQGVLSVRWVEDSQQVIVVVDPTIEQAAGWP